jgi:hypothetical protein
MIVILYNQRLLKEPAERDEQRQIKERECYSGAIVQMKNSKNNQRLLKEPGERDGQRQN